MSNLIGIASISAGDITADNVDAKASAILSIGANTATTTLNLGTNGSTQAINMGTGSGVKTITIGGGTDDTVTINGNLTVAGTTVTVNSSNATIVDKIITLNKGGAAASGALVGLEIEEGGSAAGGYLRTNATRDAWVAKAPNGSEVTIGGTSSQFLSSGASVYLPSGSNLAIGKSNAAYAVDVVGDVNISGNFRSNGALLSQFPLTLNQDPNLGLVPLSSITSNIAASTAGITYSAASLASNAIVTTDSSTSYVTMPNTVSTLSASTGITFSALVNFSAIDGYGSFILLSGGAGHSWEFGSHPSGSIRIYEVKADGDNYGLTSSTTLLTLNQTALFTACMAADGTVTMYKNGVAVTLGTRNGSSASRLPESYTYTCIYTNFVKGSTYFAAIYNTVLTPAQVLAQYNTLTAIAPTYIYNIYNSLSVPSNTYLGVGKTPAYALDVTGSINVSGSVLVNGAALSTGGGSSQFQTNSGSNIYLPAGSNLAIGKSNAIAALDVVGNINFTGNLMANGSNLAAASSYQISYVFNSPNDTTGPAFVGATGTTSVLKYTDTYNNANSALNTTNMTFTAPVSGIYMVSAYNIENKSASAPATIQVSVNGSTADTTYTINIENDSVGNASTASYPISLTAGNTVQFYVSSGGIFGSTGAGGIASKGRYSIALMNQNASLSIGQATGMGVPNQVVFTSSGTWTVPSGVVQARIQLCGGGGGGGGGGNAGFLAGGAGGGGAYCDFVASVTAVSSLNITIGAGGSGGASGNPNGANGTVGGATSISATGLNISAGGGGFGYGCGQASYRNTNVSGVGGSITLTTTTIVVNNSIITVSGSPGQQHRTEGGEVSGPNGGTSFFGGSGGGGINTSTNGMAFVGNAPADAYGGGGGGGRYVNNAGGAGAAGVVIITYFTQSGLPTNYTASAPLSMSGTTLSIANATTSAAGVVQVGSGLIASSGTVSTYNASYFFYGGLYHSQVTYPSGTSSFGLGDVTDSSDVGGTSPAIYSGFTYPSTTNYPGIDTTNNYINLPAGTWKITITGSSPFAQNTFCAVALYNNTDSKEITRSGWYASAANPNTLALIALVQPTSNKQYNIQSINLGTVPQTQGNACVMNFIVERLA